jgi:acetyl-CoA carboxylase alpha subunit
MNSPAESQLIEERLKNQTLERVNDLERDEIQALRFKVLDLYEEIYQLKKQIEKLNALRQEHNPQAVIDILNQHFNDLV